VHVVQEVKLVLFQDISDEPLCDDVHLHHGNDTLLKDFIVLDVVLGAENASLTHPKQLCDHIVKCVFQGLQVEVEWLDVLPVLNLEDPQHLTDIVRLVLELAEVAENVTNFGQFEDELILKGLDSEVRHLDAVLDHLVDVVEVVVGLPQIGKGHESFGLDSTKLLVGGLFVLHVHLIPLLQDFNGLFFPGDVVVGVKTLDS